MKVQNVLIVVCCFVFSESASSETVVTATEITIPQGRVEAREMTEFPDVPVSEVAASAEEELLKKAKEYNSKGLMTSREESAAPSPALEEGLSANEILDVIQENISETKAEPVTPVNRILQTRKRWNKAKTIFSIPMEKPVRNYTKEFKDGKLTLTLLSGSKIEPKGYPFGHIKNLEVKASGEKSIFIFELYDGVNYKIIMKNVNELNIIFSGKFYEITKMNFRSGEDGSDIYITTNAPLRFTYNRDGNKVFVALEDCITKVELAPPKLRFIKDMQFFSERTGNDIPKKLNMDFTLQEEAEAKVFQKSATRLVVRIDKAGKLSEEPLLAAALTKPEAGEKSKVEATLPLLPLEENKEEQKTEPPPYEPSLAEEKSIPSAAADEENIAFNSSEAYEPASSASSADRSADKPGSEVRKPASDVQKISENYELDARGKSWSEFMMLLSLKPAEIHKFNNREIVVYERVKNPSQVSEDIMKSGLKPYKIVYFNGRSLPIFER